jgi:hypothetical protein
LGDGGGGGCSSGGCPSGGGLEKENKGEQTPELFQPGAIGV